MSEPFAAKSVNGQKFHIFTGASSCECRGVHELAILGQPHRDVEEVDPEEIAVACKDAADLEVGDE